MRRALAIGAVLAVAWVLLGGVRVERSTTPTLPIDNNATRRGQPPWAASERNTGGLRKIARAGALRGLDQAWADMCAGEGRRKLLGGLDYYFEQRGMQERGYPLSWGEPGAQFIRQAWSTADDSRIERLTLEIYKRGYLRPEDLRPHVRARVADLVRGEKVIGKPCALTYAPERSQ